MHRKVLSCFCVLFFALALLTSCDSVFTGSLKGNVIDENGDGLADAEVALFFDKAKFESEKERLSGIDSRSEFNPDADSKAVTSADGSFSFVNVLWETSSPLFGPDGDRRSVYILCYHDGYQLGELVENVKITSDGMDYAGTIELVPVSEP